MNHYRRDHAGTWMQPLPDHLEPSATASSTRSVAAREIAELHAGFRGDMATLRTGLHDEIVALRSQLQGQVVAAQAELRGDMARVRTELRGEVAELRTRLHRNDTDPRTDVVIDLRHEPTAGAVDATKLTAVAVDPAISD